MQFFNKKLPAWMLLAALVIVGAGAATGLVLKDQITGTTTIAVSQALEVETPIAFDTANDGDAFLGTVNDNGVEWAAHFEANNGDVLKFALPIINNGDQGMAAILVMDYPEGLTIDVETSYDTTTGTNDELSQYATSIDGNTWKFYVESGAAGDQVTVGDWDVQETAHDSDDGIEITIAIEDAQPTGFYEITGVIYPVNV